jgi:hypothetical protein
MNFERETKNKLPIVLIRIVNEYLQDRWKKKFNLVMKQILDTMNPLNNLQAKKKYKFIFGGVYRQAHRIYREFEDDIRIASLEPEYEGLNSVLLSPYKLLLSFKVFYYEDLASFEEEFLIEEFHRRNDAIGDVLDAF